MPARKLNIDPTLPLSALFRHVSDNHWSMLLCSGDSEHVNATFDLMVWAPIATITSRKDSCQLTDLAHSKSESLPGSPLVNLQTALDRYFPQQPQDTEHPFYAGALGHFGYDLGRRFERLPNHAKDDYSTPAMAVGLYSKAIIRYKQSGAYYLVGYQQSDLDCAGEWEARAQQQTQPLSPFRLTSAWQSNMQKSDYLQRFAQVKDYLTAGDCYQVNLAQRFESRYQGDEYDAFLRLHQVNNAPFSAFIRLPESSILSVSPERFLQVEQGKVETKPIKGTRRHHHHHDKDSAEIADLRASQKDRAENLMIVDLLRNDLSKTCLPGSVQVPSLFAVETFPAVHHLVSTVTGQLAPPNTGLNLLQGAFPGGSITGAPKVRAMEIIDELEPHRRNIYCGSIGYVAHHGHMDTNICIRTLLCEQQKVYCWAGGGVVIDSVGDNEYQETLDKVNKILPVLEQGCE